MVENARVDPMQLAALREQVKTLEERVTTLGRHL